MGLFKQSGVVGLEFDTGVIRAVEMEGKPGSARLVAAGQVDIPEDAVVEGSVVQPGAVGEALRRLWGEAGFKSRNVVMGLYNQSVITRLINFPKVPAGKLEQAIRLQAQDYIPIPLSQMVLDFAVVGEREDNGRQELEVLLVAAKTSTLEKGIAALEESRLNLAVVDASPLALMRALPEKKLVGTVAVVDISNGSGSLLMVVDGVPRFARVIPVSLRQYASQLGYSLLAAPIRFEGEEGSDQYVAAAGTEAMNVFESWAHRAADELRSTISYFVKMDASGREVDSLVLSGIGARVTGLAAIIEEELGLPVEVVQPLANVKASGKKQVDRLVAKPDFAVSTGLALRGLEG